MKRKLQIRRTVAALIVAIGASVVLFLHPDLQQAVTPQVQAPATAPAGKAADALDELAVKGRAPKTGYSRDQFGDGWATKNGCDTRNIILHRDLTDTVENDKCQITSGTLDDLRREEDTIGYATRLRHGEIGKGLNDYDAIFSILRDRGFDGWISVEDGVDGIEQLQRSVAFLRGKIAAHWG